MVNRIPPRPLPPGAAPDGNRDLLLSGVWVVKPFVAVDAFPQSLVLTAADRKLAAKLAKPVRLCRREIGRHFVELLLERGVDRSVGLSLCIPTAENQFKDPYILMEAEKGNTREVAVREVHFHLQGRLSDRDLAKADWADYFGRAARRLDLLRGAGRRAGAKPGRTKKTPVRAKRAPRRIARASKKRPARRGTRPRRA